MEGAHVDDGGDGTGVRLDHREGTREAVAVILHGAARFVHRTYCFLDGETGWH